MTQEQLREEVRKQFSAYGKMGGRPCKLTMKQAEDIRARALNGERREALAAEYGVGKNTIGQIVRGRTYTK